MILSLQDLKNLRGDTLKYVKEQRKNKTKEGEHNLNWGRYTLSRLRIEIQRLIKVHKQYEKTN